MNPLTMPEQRTAAPPSPKPSIPPSPRGFIQQHAVLAYFALVFAISYGGLFLMVGPGALPLTAAHFAALERVAERLPQMAVVW